MTISTLIGAEAAAAVDLAFPVALVAALAREIVAGRNWRNLPMLGALGLLGMAKGLAHAEVLGCPRTGRRAAASGCGWASRSCCC